jgi:hypothetical protein
MNWHDKSLLTNFFFACSQQTTVTPGGWVYRITEEDNSGNSADICQCLVEVQTEEEQKAALIAGVGFAVFAVVAVVAGIAADPYGGF